MDFYEFIIINANGYATAKRRLDWFSVDIWNQHEDFIKYQVDSRCLQVVIHLWLP